MTVIRRIFRPAVRLAALAVALLAGLTAAPAFAMVPHPGAGGTPGPARPAPVHTVTVTVGGTPGWQIALLMVGAAMLAAAIVVLLYRTRAARFLRPAASTH